jgi:hypothetical protein
MTQLPLFTSPQFSPKVYHAKLSQLEKGMIFRFPNGTKRYQFDERIAKKFWYEDAYGQEFSTTWDSQVIIIYP